MHPLSGPRFPPCLGTKVSARTERTELRSEWTHVQNVADFSLHLSAQEAVQRLSMKNSIYFLHFIHSECCLFPVGKHFSLFTSSLHIKHTLNCKKDHSPGPAFLFFLFFFSLSFPFFWCYFITGSRRISTILLIFNIYC